MRKAEAMQPLVGRKRKQKADSGQRKAGPTPPSPPVNGGETARVRGRKSPVEEQYGEPARLLFVEGRKSLREICAAYPQLHLSTLRRWYQRDGWEQQRAKFQSTPQGFVSDVEYALRALIDEARAAIRKSKRPPPNFFDDVSKAAKAITMLRGESYFNGHMMQTLELFSAFLERLPDAEAQQLRQALGKLAPDFVAWVAIRRTSSTSG